MKGAPKKPEHLKKIRVTYRIPAWMDHNLFSLADQEERTQNSLLEEGLRYVFKKYGIRNNGLQDQIE